MLKQYVIKIGNNTENLVVCSYPTRDLDRLLSFYNAAKQSGRDLVIDLKQAYILKLFQTSDNWKSVYPKPKDQGIKIYIPKRGWGLIDKDIDYWGKKMLLEDYYNWAQQFLDYDNHVDYRDISSHQKETIYYCSPRICLTRVYVQRLTIQESLQYIRDKLGSEIGVDHFNHVRAKLKQDVKRNLKYLQKYRFVYVRKLFDRVEEIR
jgi:hypothetical protein